MFVEYDLLFSLPTTFVAHWSERSPFIVERKLLLPEKKKQSYLTYLDWKVQWQGHISWLFFDDCCWFSLAAVQRLQWSVADTWAWIAVSILGEHAANSWLPCCALAKSCDWVEETLEHNMLLFQYLKMGTTVNLAVWHHTLRNWDFAITENKQYYY